MDFKKRIKSLPESPGVYLMKDSSSGIIYAGKAKNLRKRVSSYFRSSAGFPIKTVALVSSIREIEYITTGTEKEALILENQLIKKFHPKYNILMRDDKTYPHLRLDVGSDFPRLEVVRKRGADREGRGKARYFGPYPDVKALKKTLKLIGGIFPLVRCGERAFRSMAKSGNPERCLDYQMGRCLAPCAGNISRKEYGRFVRDIILFLSGEKEQLLKKLEREMKRCSKKLDFERAGRLRDRVKAINSITQKVSMRRTSLEKLSLIKKENELVELKKALGLKRLPARIECFDISNISGKEAVGSMAFFRDARPEKSGYRKFRIKTVHSIDDVKMMKEIVRRRYTRVIKEGLPAPDLIIVDGGRGHVNGAAAVLDELNLKRVPIIGLAKAEELIYIPGKPKPVCLDRSSAALYLLERIRDEAHRFALNYHRKLRSRRNFQISREKD